VLESAPRAGSGRGLSPGLQRPRRDLLVDLSDDRVCFSQVSVSTMKR